MARFIVARLVSVKKKKNEVKSKGKEETQEVNEAKFQLIEADHIHSKYKVAVDSAVIEGIKDDDILTIYILSLF